MARRIKLTLEYDGTDFKGWQVQSGLAPGENGAAARTVQGEVEHAIRIATGHPIRIAGASRTDTGAHALGQVASLLLPDEVAMPTDQICHAINSHLARDVSVTRAEEVDLNFHAQRDATGKIYSYSLFSRYERSARLRRTHWHVRFALDTEAMRQAAQSLIGTHDFTSFVTRLNETQLQRNAEGKPALETTREIRWIHILTDPEFPERICIRLEGSGFLYQMVRTIVGSLVDVGRGFRPPEWMTEVLTAHDRRKAGPTAPALGLCLERVLYEG
ncbi:MAG: tRNA pseudouridine(38-40) synthase TruA [Planctomycetota bacterium]